MRVRWIAIIGLSCVYWTLAIGLALLASVAPCGLAPGAWCEMDGSSWFGAALHALGPSGVLLLVTVIYAAAMWLILRRQKVH